MPAIAYRRLLRHRLTLRRNTTSTSGTGATTFAWSTYATHVLANVQDAGGRMRQEDLGQMATRKKKAVLGAEAVSLGVAENDLAIIEDTPEPRTFKVTHVHMSFDATGHAHHVELSLEAWVPGGGA